MDYTYDAIGRMKTLTTYRSYPGTPEVTTWNYDAASGFLTSKVYADSKQTTYTYNPGGQLLTRAWARGVTTTYGYDNAGTQNSIDYSDSTPDISFTYNRMEQLASVTDAAGTRTNTYDANLRLASSTLPYILNGNLEYTYDALGRRSSVKLMQDTTEKLNTAYTYDAMSRIATVSDGTNTAEYTRLSGTNLLNTVAVRQGANTLLTTTKTYDAFGKLLSTSSVAGATTRTYSYEYNDKDQRTKLTLADGSYWEYTYDDKGQVTGGIKYDAEGHAIPGQSFGYTFDDIGNRLTETKGMPLMAFNYTANNVNQYTQRTVPGYVPITGSALAEAKVTVKDTDSGQIYSTTRDGKYFSKAVPVSNTLSAKEANLEVNAVKYDAVQDKDIIKTVSGKYYVAQTPQSYTYDDDGNMLTNGAWTYIWNGENRMIQAEKSDMKLEFVYDFMGRRISKRVYTGSTGNWTLASEKKFVYDGYKQIAEFDASDALVRSYTWQPVDLDVPLWVKDGANYYYYIIDGNKNVRAMVDVSGNEVAQYDYNPFGKVIASGGTYEDINLFRFSSEYNDDETALIYYNYRYYDADLGRWLSRDPIGEKGGYNLYGMVSNNLIDNWDYLGSVKVGFRGMNFELSEKGGKASLGVKLPNSTRWGAGDFEIAKLIFSGSMEIEFRPNSKKKDNCYIQLTETQHEKKSSWGFNFRDVFYATHEEKIWNSQYEKTDSSRQTLSYKWTVNAKMHRIIRDRIWVKEFCKCFDINWTTQLEVEGAVHYGKVMIASVFAYASAEVAAQVGATVATAEAAKIPEIIYLH